MRFFQALTKISKMAYLVAFIIFLMRASQFMSLPFLAIYLTQEGALSSGQIGLVLGISGFILSTTGLFNGIYVDRNSPQIIVVVALLLSGFCYFGFAMAMHSFWGLLLVNALLGWFRCLIEISLLSILVKHTKAENLSYAHSARFIGANIGVALGPLLGALMATRQSLLIFFIAGTIHLGLGIVVLCYRQKTKEFTANKVKPPILDNFRAVFQDKTLLTITFINLILWAVYAQLDTTIPQYLAQVDKNPAALFSRMMVVNALICVFFQPLILRWAELFSLKISGIIGSALFSLSFLFITFQPSANVMLISAMLMSFAELFTLPINGLLVLRVAPKHLLASYNGLANLGLLGLSLGPVIGGYGMHFIDGSYIFFISALLPLLAAWLYFKASAA
jgi:predicted MFS family arabinose efflux permease